MIRSVLLATVALSLSVSAAPSAPSAKPVVGNWGVDMTARDTAVKPGDDFFDYVNGAWAKRTVIAPDRTFVGIDSVLNDENDRKVRAIVEDMAKNPQAHGVIGQQIGDYYATWMDETAIEAAGTAPLEPWLARVDAVKDKTGLIGLFATQEYTGPMGIGVIADPANPKQYVAYVGQAGLGMPNRDYYLLTGEKYDAYRKAYRDYVIKMQTLAGIADAAAKADRIIALETALAREQWTPERSRDIQQIYHPMNRAQMIALAPQFQWTGLLEQSGLGAVPTVIVAETTAIQAAGKLLDTEPLSTWKDYVAFHFIRTHAQYLPHAFDQANFDFYSKTLRDVPTQRDRWKRGVQQVNGALGEAVGQIYVQRHYPPASDAQMGELIANLRAALQERIEKNVWMDDATRKEALAKLASFDPRTGHPPKYIDYSSLAVKRGDLLGNAIRSDEFVWNLTLSRLPKPVDRTLWDMTPQTNNAYYDPLQNQITFPAAILQPPYFDPNADPAANYGSIGATIGHEIGHGFDDQGRQFDATGKLRDWWTADSAKKFAERTAVLVKQYDGYEPVPGVHIKGQLTLGENIGDLGGLEMAYAAYRRYVAAHGEPPVIDGLTGDQRFFIAYGYSWQRKEREGALRQQLLTDPHSPGRQRVNGVVRNVDAWYAAFNVKHGDKLYLPPEQRVHIW
ncbi:M13 family metallopeptidase [soil metagenome]